LTTQQRAVADPEHTARIQQLVDTKIKHPITQDHINYIQNNQLSKNDVSDPDSPWNTEAVCLSASNSECALITRFRGSFFAMIKKSFFFFSFFSY
jgi:hypothetical protein